MRTWKRHGKRFHAPEEKMTDVMKWQSREVRGCIMKTASLRLNDQPEGKRSSTYPPAPGGRFKRLFWKIRDGIVGFFVIALNILRDIFRRCPRIDVSKKCSGQVCVMTGGARGIGFEIVRKLLEMDYTVILGVRNISVMQKGIDRIRDGGLKSGQVTIFHLDLKSLRSVRTFSDAVLSSNEGARIDMLINNAGIFQDCYELTEDDIECHFQVNYLSHFLLTNLLLPRIKETATVKNDGSCHIINSSSVMHYVGSIRFDNLAQKKLFVGSRCYYDTKLCQVIHAKTMQRQLEQEGFQNIFAYAVHPGIIQTDIYSDVGILETLFRPIMKLICRTTEGGAHVTLYPALSPTTSTACGGKYFANGSSANTNREADDAQISKRLWEFSNELITCA